MSNKHALVILSGGLDSAVVAYLLRAQGRDLTALWIDYGQRHKRERQSAEKIATHLGAEFCVVDLSSMGALLKGNALTDAIDVPHGHYAAESMRLTIVPLRNALFLTVACAVAIARDIPLVGMGVHAGDHPIYPDCRPAFFHAFGRMVDNFTEEQRVTICTPFIGQTKTDIVRTGASFGVPFVDTWSCYEGGVVHCGKCGTCVERREAFHLAGIHDPTVYAAT